MQVNDFADFGIAVNDKLLREINPGPDPVPEPSTLLLMGADILGLVGYNRKRSSKNQLIVFM
jgi:hypothetical protein